MLQRVLVPIDGSPHAEAAIAYAESLLAPEGEMILHRVVPVPEPVTALLPRTQSASREEVREWWHERARSDFELARRQVTIDAGRVRELVTEGDPATEIAKLAAEENVDLIAMATHGRGAIGQLVFGSVANRISRVTPVPILVVRPTDNTPRRPNYQRIVLPYDGSELATEAFPLAVALSKQLDLPIHLIEAVYQPASAAPDSVISGVLHAAQEAATRDLARASAQLQEMGVEPTWEVVIGSPFQTISLATRPGDIVIVTSHGRTGVHRWLLGSVAEKLVQQATVPVILVPAKARQRLVDSGRNV